MLKHYRDDNSYLNFLSFAINIVTKKNTLKNHIKVTDSKFKGNIWFIFNYSRIYGQTKYIKIGYSMEAVTTDIANISSAGYSCASRISQHGSYHKVTHTRLADTSRLSLHK